MPEDDPTISSASKKLLGPCGYCGRNSLSEPFRSPVALFCLPCVLKRCFPYLTRRHRNILFWFWLVFGVLTFLLMLPGAISGHGEPLGNAIVAGLFAFSGPFTGMISRGWDSAYGAPQVALYCSVILGAGFLFQLVPIPLKGAEYVIRMFMWAVGLLGWFAGTLLSVLIANS